jgi:hypothetical protein
MPAYRSALLALSCSLIALPAWADIAIPGVTNLYLYGDARLRLERDQDSYRTDGSERDDRDRARIRARLGLKWQPTDFFLANVRARTGNDNHQQSGHITVKDFNGNDEGSSDVNLDKWYGQFNWRGLEVWGGRNSLPWWKQNDLFWDDDVTPRGVGATLKLPVGSGQLTLNTGYYNLPAGMRDYTGDAYSAQLVWEQELDSFGITLVGGMLNVNADAEADEFANQLLLQDNALRDYKLWVVSYQLRVKDLPRDFHIGIDYLHNAEDYAADDPSEYTAFNRDEVDGYVLQAIYGGVKKRGDWLIGTYYSHIDLLAVHNSYAQDDWVRWGNSDQSTSSNFKGPELRAGLGLGHNMNLILRAYKVRAINNELPGDTRKQTGERIRLDYNWSF